MILWEVLFYGLEAWEFMETSIRKDGDGKLPMVCCVNSNDYQNLILLFLFGVREKYGFQYFPFT